MHGVCAGSWDKFQRYVVPRAMGPIIALSGQTSIAVAYNSILAACEHRAIDALVLQHDDLEITDPDAQDKIYAALDRGDGLLGVAGGGGQRLDWWNQSPIGHQRTDVMNIDFGERTGLVQLLEGSLLIFSAKAVRHLRFDTLYEGFHGYDEIAHQAWEQYMTVRVIDLDTHHHTNMGFKSAESQAQWEAANRRYQHKWEL
jgi:hypothetical protein